MSNKYKYQTDELSRFNSRNSNRENRFFDTVKEFEERWKGDIDSLYQQLEWIENGTYGAGTCLALQQQYYHTRGNRVARIGQVFLAALWGTRFPHWYKLSPEFQAKLTEVVTKWIESKKEFAIQLLPELGGKEE